jgi:hypothetical protein
MKYKVSVEKRMYATGAVAVDCGDPDMAVQLVQKKISNGDIQTADVEWGEPEYEDSSFWTTDDVENTVDEVDDDSD